jgi:hypothetical protein
MTRRNFLKFSGAALLALTGAGLYRAADQGVFSTAQGPAYEPWQRWQGESNEGLVGLISAAILSANPHNIQPWQFRVQQNQVEILLDQTRNIGSIDPFFREVYTGLGCALENLVQSAAAHGLKSTVSLLPEANQPALAARVVLSKDTVKESPLYQAIPNRHTNRSAYDLSRPVTLDQITRLESQLEGPDQHIFWFSSEAQRQAFSQASLTATEIMLTDKEQCQDTHRWWRQDWHAIQNDRAGITLDAQGMPVWMSAAAKILPDMSMDDNNKQWLDGLRTRTLPNTPLFGILAVRDSRDHTQQLRGGRSWQRIHLQATLDGLGLQPLNQLTERADRENQQMLDPRCGRLLADLIGNKDWQALMSFRAGYPTAPALPSPRRAVQDVLAA